MTRPQPITEAMLHGFVDGRLSPAERAAVQTYLDANPEAAAALALWQRQRDAISTLYAPVAAEPVPNRLDPHRLALRQRGRQRAWTRMAVAAVVLVGLGLGAGWYGHTLLQPEESASDMLIASAVNAHNLYVKESSHAVEVAASDKGHLVTWLSNRLRHQIEAPDLSSQGFQLVGGRLLPPGAYQTSGPAAQLMYENATADRVTVYVTAALPTKDRPFAFETVDGREAYYWANDAITCTVVGDLPKPQMEPLARLINQQLTWRVDPGQRG
ncbi:MAG TPA: anti-sigma factor [Devosiaceae bacterium]|jgi:anti-sigma factor RsiW